MSFKTLNKIKVKGRRVLVRIDINSEIIKGKPLPSPRFKASAETISFLKKKGAKVVCIAHQSQPKKGDFTSLRKHALLLNKFTKIKFVNDIIGKKAINSIKDLKDGEAILLENIRFLKEEYKPGKNKLVKTLCPLFSLYVNDAFSVSHRNQTSLTSFAVHLPNAIGKTFERELENANKLKRTREALFILGGNKPKDLLPLLKKKNILAGGTLSLLALMAKGENLGKEKQILKKDLSLIKKIKPYLKNIALPKDLAIQKNKKRQDLSLDDFPQNYPIYDIGPETLDLYLKKIKQQKKGNTIFLKGPSGNTAIKNFEISTRKILKALESSKAHTIISGGHSTTSLERFKINKKKISHISLSGGALVSYISGEKLPALEALKKCKEYIQ